MTAACQQIEPPPAPPVEVALLPVPPQPPPQPAHRILRLAWSFQTRADHCIATAAGDRAAVTITIRRSKGVNFHVALPASEASRIATRSLVKVRFGGPSGNWKLQASGDAKHGIDAPSAQDEVSLGRILILLGGGTLDFAVPAGLPSLLIPPAGPEGQAWSDCAHSQMI